MKVKSFAILATSGFLAAALTYAVPALAEDMTPSAQEIQQSMSADNSQTTPSNNASQQNDLNNSVTATNNNNTANQTTTDESAPERDSATGDDDY